VGTIRREVIIDRPPDEVWPLIVDPEAIAGWFPGIESCTVDGTSRVIVTGAGLPMPEEIVTVDPLQRRFQYRITGGLVREHLSTIDVLDLEDGTSLVVYSADANPSTMALVIAGAAGNALQFLKTQLEGDS